MPRQPETAITSLHRQAYLLALFGDRDDPISTLYVVEKVRIAFRAQTVRDLTGTLDNGNLARFNDIHTDLRRTRS